MKDRLNRNEKMTWISFPALEATGCVYHGFSTREGGVSRGIYNTMNLSYTRGDKKADVDENFRRFCEAIHIDPASLVLTQQTHTAHVIRVTEKDKGNGITRPQQYHDVDGLVTDVPGVALITHHADCVPLFFVDPVHKAIGLSHSGWRGTAGKMGAVTVEKMRKEFGSRPEELVAAIGPSICRKCYEVSEDVYRAFSESFLPEDVSAVFDRKGNGKYQLDLWEANRRILIRAGVREENISVTGYCTHCHPDLLWSHRTLGKDRGSLAAFLCLKEEGLGQETGGQ